MRIRVLAAFFVAILLFPACRSNGEGTNGAGPKSTPGAEPTANASIATDGRTAVAGTSCSPARPDGGGEARATMTSGGIERAYFVHVPASYDGVTAMPLVFNLHGYSSNATDQDRYSGLPAMGEERGFIVVSPEGSGNPQRWDFPVIGTVDEVAFIGELLDRMEAELCVDTTRVYAAGMSNGAAISTFIACGLPGRIAAIAEVAATAGPRLCGPDAQIPIITFRGTEDFCVPYEGGTSMCGLRLPVMAAEEVTRLWGEHNGCSAAPATTQVSEHVRTTAYGACAGNADAILYTIEGGGHTWPGANDVPRLGFTTQEIDATELIWAFFEAHAR